jgi:hypothetical protein
MEAIEKRYDDNHVFVFVDNPRGAVNADEMQLNHLTWGPSISSRPKRRVYYSDESTQSLQSFASQFDNMNTIKEHTNGNGADESRPKRWRPSVYLTRNSNVCKSQTDLANLSSNKIKKIVAADVAACIINETKTLGLMAALLSSWAAAVYSGDAPLDEGLCYGMTMLKISYAIFGMSLGFFFICYLCGIYACHYFGFGWSSSEVPL